MTHQSQRQSPSEFHKLLDYDPKTGVLIWKIREWHVFSNEKDVGEKIAATWNTKYAGKEAGGFRNGYRVICVLGKIYSAHRVIWAMVFGCWPPDQIDHINGIKDDNRIENLRSVSNMENNRNRRMARNNKTGANGVAWQADRNKYRATIGLGTHKKCLGNFEKLEDAVSARKAAEIELGYSPNHGAPRE